MNVISKMAEDAPAAVGVTDDPASLSRFLHPGCAGMIWQRQTPPDIQNWLNDLDPDALPRGRDTLSMNAVDKTLQHLFDSTGMPRGSEYDWLHADIVALAKTFSDLMFATFLRLRLDVVTTNACRKFHIDAIAARLVCTYRGTGTQYGISLAGNEPRHVSTVPTGSPILLRGTLWPEQPRSGLLHRSPPIEGTGETRLVLVLDPVFDLDEDM